MSRIPDPILNRIRELYAPQTEDGEVRPDVLWVGPFIDGIIQYVPEIFPVLWRNADYARNPTVHRRYMKNLIMDSGRNRYGERAVHVDAFQMSMRRLTWPRTSTGDPLTIYFMDSNERGIINLEYGEVRNSPHVVTDPTTRVPAIVDGKGLPTDPLILLDGVYGLHYLLVGDEFDFTWQVRGQPARMQFRLQPRSLGSSLLTPERVGEVVIV